jgi:hypothetical protein
MRPMRPLRTFVYALALTAILFSQQLVSQTQSTSQPNTNAAAASKAKAQTGDARCTSNGTYVNSRGETVQ